MAPLLKELYNESYIELLSRTIVSEYSSFDAKKFKMTIFDGEWKNRELKSRMRHIASSLGLYLPKEYKSAISILKLTFKKMNYDYGLENMIFQDFVAVYGVYDVETSLSALESFTINSSSEFTIREFLLLEYEITMKKMFLWAHSENEHVRRLVSEGSRSRLPWAIALPIFKKDPSPVLKLLDLLKDDESAYVRKSVANSLNDISKDNPEVVKKIVSQWIGFSKNRDALLKHGCRTLLKASDKKTLELFGYRDPKGLHVKNFTYDKEVNMGEKIGFSFLLNSTQILGKLRIEFAIEFLRKNSRHNKKVFKISEGDYLEQDKYIQKSYSFKPISTRVYYSGVQRLSIIINGVIFKKVEFILF